MFRTKKTKIVSTPVEEILEVEEPVLAEIPEIEQEIEYQQVANIEYLAVQGTDGDNSYGILTDYDGAIIYYEWDTRVNRIVRLSAEKLNSLTWKLCEDVLRKYYVKPEAPKVEEPIGPQIEKVVNKALSPVADAF